MKNLLFLILLFFSTPTNAQISFEKGYFISNDGNRTECFIKNLDWKNNPIEFKYKLQLNDSEFNVQNISTVKEFGINTNISYRRFAVEIDRTSNKIKNLTINEDPVWKTETLFLKILVEGDANLFEYTDENLTRFFYQIKNSKVEQLIYLKYLSEIENGGNLNINENNSYQKQLFDNLKCGNITVKEIKKLMYKREELTNYFIHYNECENPIAIKNKPIVKKGKFLLRITPSINFTNLTIPDRKNYNVSIDAGSKAIFKISLEGEYILPYNKNKWSLFIDPTYQKYENETTYSVKGLFLSDETYTAKINYSSIEIPIGLRHYMFLNQKSKIFLNIAYIFEANGKATINYDKNEYYSSRTMTSQNFAFGFGYTYKNISLEMRMNTNKNLLCEYSAIEANYKSIGLILGYKIL